MRLRGCRMRGRRCDGLGLGLFGLCGFELMFEWGAFLWDQERWRPVERGRDHRHVRSRVLLHHC